MDLSLEDINPLHPLSHYSFLLSHPSSILNRAQQEKKNAFQFWHYSQREIKLNNFYLKQEHECAEGRKQRGGKMKIGSILHAERHVACVWLELT